MSALIKSTVSWRVLFALVGFAIGYGTNAAAQREDASGVVPAMRPAVRTALGSGAERRAFGGHSDVPFAEAADLASGAGWGSEVSRPLPAL